MTNSLIPAQPSQPERNEGPKSLSIRTEQDERVLEFMHRYGEFIRQRDTVYNECVFNASQLGAEYDESGTQVIHPGIELPPSPISVFTYSQASETLKDLSTGIPNELHGIQTHLKHIPSVLSGIFSIDRLFQAHYLKESLKHPDHDVYEDEYQQIMARITGLEQSAHDQGFFLSESSIHFWADSAHALHDRLYTWAYALHILEDIKNASLDRVVELQSMQGANVQSASEYIHLHDHVRHEVENAMNGLPSMFDAMSESRGILNMGARRAHDAMKEAEALSHQELEAAIRAMNALNTVAQQALENADIVAEQHDLVQYMMDLNELQFPIMQCWLELWNEMSRAPIHSTVKRFQAPAQTRATFEEPQHPHGYIEDQGRPPNFEDGVVNE